MPKGTATYWKHDENQDDGDDVTMTIYEFLVDYMLLMTCTYLKSLFSLMYMCTLHVVTFWHDNVQWFNSCSKENINRHNFFYDRAYSTVHSKCNVWNAVTFDIY